MIQQFSSSATKWLQRVGAISSDKCELYEYAIYSFIFAVLPFIILFVVSWITGMCLKATLLIIPFMLIRKFSRGFHFKSSGACFVVPTLLLISLPWAINCILVWEYYVTCSLLVGVSIVCIIRFSPIESTERTLCQKERQVFKTVSVTLTSVFTIVYLIFSYLGLWGLLCLSELVFSFLVCCSL